MIKTFLAAAALAGSAFAAAGPASAMTIDPAAGATEAGTTAVALYCRPNGECIRAPRAGYVIRPAPVVAPPVYVAPRVYVAPPVVVAPRVYAPGPVVRVKPNGAVVYRP